MVVIQGELLVNLSRTLMLEVVGGGRYHTYTHKHMHRSIVFVFVFPFLGPHLRPMEVPRLGVQSELQLPVYTTATAMLDPSHVCDLHHSSRQCWIPDPLGKARDPTCILMNTSQIHFHCAMTGTPIHASLKRQVTILLKRTFKF